MVRVSLLQHAVGKDKDDTIDKTLALIQQASANSDLIVLQELHQDIYFPQHEDTRYFEWAQAFDEDVAFWAGVAKEYDVVLVTSLFEARAPGLYHNTAVVFERDGSVAGKYRKMHIPDDPGFYEKFYFTPGDLGFEPIDTSVGRLGVMVCWDQWYPEAARLMALKGAQMLIYPTAIGWDVNDDAQEQARQRESWITIQRSHAVANGIPVIACNRVGFEIDPSGILEGTQFWGSSFIAGPQGEVLAQGDEENTCVVSALVDSKRTKAIRDIWPFLRDRRIDAYEQITKRYID